MWVCDRAIDGPVRIREGRSCGRSKAGEIPASVVVVVVRGIRLEDQSSGRSGVSSLLKLEENCDEMETARSPGEETYSACNVAWSLGATCVAFEESRDGLRAVVLQGLLGSAHPLGRGEAALR